MSRLVSHASLAFGSLVLLALAPGAALAAWPHDSATNLGLGPAVYGSQHPRMVPDGAGGSIVFWLDVRDFDSDLGIYATRVTAAGTIAPGWNAGGNIVCAAFGNQSDVVAVPDGAGGAIVAWQDFRNLSDFDIYAQHILANGTLAPGWPGDGFPVCTALGDQLAPAIISDNSGGAIIGWEDTRGADRDIYALHVTGSGGFLGSWTLDGTPVCRAPGDQHGVAMASDGLDGAIIAWTDERHVGNPDIFAQHLAGAGYVVPGWPLNGLTICNAPGEQTAALAVSDGEGGAIVAWSDARAGDHLEAFARRVNGAGTFAVGWTSNGTAVAGNTSHKIDLAIASDDAGGVLLAWADARNGADFDIYAQHLTVAGQVAPGWPADGFAACVFAGDQRLPTIASDGASGALIAWQDSRNGLTADIYAQRATPTGAPPGWPLNGAAICTASDDRQFPAIQRDGMGGAVVVWNDNRSGVGGRIYVQRVDRFGQLGNPEPRIVSVRDVPNDQGGKVKVSWSASYLDAAASSDVASYLVLRSAPPNLVARAVAAGARIAQTLAEVPAASAQAILSIQRDGVTSFWEFVGSQSALHLSGYSLVAPTTADSIAGSNPPTLFMVVATSASGNLSWFSSPDSGYSVDNLAPARPTAFAAVYLAGRTALHWSRSPESDFAHYHLYRGGTSGFVPGPSNLIAAPSDTGYSDPALAPYFYRLSAVDIHGNESPRVLAQPSGTVDVPHAAPTALMLEPVVPNPARGEARLRFALPQDGDVRIAIYDAAGREVRELMRGELPAGDHLQRWDGRDSAGNPVISGLYFVRLEALGRALTRRLVAIR